MEEKRLKNWEKPKINDKKLQPKYHFLVYHKNNLELGENTDIGAFTYINAKNGVIVEKNVQIGSHCSLYSISTIDNKEGKIIIKENAKICTHCTIMPGVTIGKNSIVGAHSFVTKDVPDDTLFYGVPAKFIRKISK